MFLDSFCQVSFDEFKGEREMIEGRCVMQKEDVASNPSVFIL